MTCISTAAAATGGLSISALGYKVESVTPTDTAGAFDIVARAAVLNNGAPATNVTAQIFSSTAGAIVVDGDVTFGNVATTQPLRPVRSVDTFKMRFILPTRPFSWLDALRYARTTLDGLSWRISCDSCFANRPPVANAGTDQTAYVGGTVALDGTGSSDVDGDPLIYEWSLVETPASSAAAIAAADPAAPLASFVVDRPGRYVAQLIVRDAESDSAPDTAIISTVNSRPRAVAGPDQTVAVGQQVLLSAAGSADADGDALSFRWALTPPTGSAAVLVDATSASTTFVADRAGEYLVQLIANDGHEDSEPDTVIVSTRNSAPVAVAGPPEQTAFVGRTVRLDGSVSADADGDALSFNWSLIALPLDSSAVLEDAATPHAWFVPDRAGVYVAQLIVGDGHIDSAPSTSRIVVEVEPPRSWIELSLVTIAEGEQGWLAVTGAAGSVEPYALVLVGNAANGSESEVRADATGAFTLTVRGELGDALTVRIEDRAGGSSETIEVPYPADLLVLRIDSPSDSDSIAERSVVLRGEVRGPLETAIAANGLPAAILDNAGLRPFLVRVPLAPGENLISIVASVPHGARVERQLRVTRTDVPPFSIEANTAEGIGPLEVTFEVHRHTVAPIVRVEADLDDDGTIDATQGSRPMPFTHRYSQPGMYQARFTVITMDEQAWTYEVPVTVHAPSTLDARVRAAWGRFLETSGAGDVQGTLGQMTPDAAERYAPMFEALRGSLPRIVASFSGIDLAGFHGGIAEYVIAREVDGQQAAFLVYFVQTSDGAWRIASL